jgi:hypothetical protein
MSDFTWFFLVLGANLSILAIAMGVILRDTEAPLHIKLSIPVVLVFLGAWLPAQVTPMMGRPVETTMEELPKEILLLQFYPVSRDKVDLWIIEKNRTRAYEVPLGPNLQRALTEAREGLKDGVVTLEQGEGNPNNHGGASTPSGPEPGYTLKKHTMPTKTQNGSSDE